MSKVMLFLFLSLLTQIFPATYTVDGYANLEGETDHSGIQVFFQRVAPDNSFSYTVYTNSAGYYSSVVEGGWYDILYSKSEFISKDTADVALYSNMTLANVLLEKKEHCVIIEAGTHKITESIEVINGDTLIIKPGARLELNPGVSINVNGLLIAEGTEKDSIIFTGYNGGTWGSVKLNDICDNNSSISYCYFEKSNSTAVKLYSCQVTVSNCTFYNNVSTGNNNTTRGGALSLSGYYESPIVRDCRFYNNSNESYWFGGGAITVENSPDDDIIIYNCIFRGNTSEEGGAIFCYTADPVLSNCIFENNSADNGGAIYLVVAKSDIGASYLNPMISNCIITRNTSYEEGAGIYMDGYDLTIINSIISTNYGNGIFTTKDLSIYNSIISSNGGYGIYNSRVITHNIQYTDVHDGIYNKQPYLLVNVTTNANGDPCDAYQNISMDPRFVDAANGDFRMLSDSPCIDAGINTITDYTFPERDLAENFRIWDGDGNSTILVDMGAYEYGSQDIINSPTNINISVIANTLTITWDLMTGANSYLIYHSNDPYGSFELIGTLGTNTWNTTIDSSTKKFYQIVASSDAVK
jgi:hypothetical protein